MRKRKPKLFSLRATNKFVAYILAKLKLTYAELTDCLGYDVLAKTHSTPEAAQVKLRCLLYFVACHGYDLEELEWESEQRVAAVEAAKMLGTTTEAAERLIKQAGIPLLTEKPVSILRADLMLFAANPEQAPRLSRLLRNHPLALWRRQQGISHYDFAVRFGRAGEAIGLWEAGLSLPADPKLIKRLEAECGPGTYYAMVEWKKLWDAVNKVSPYHIY